MILKNMTNINQWRETINENPIVITSHISGLHRCFHCRNIEKIVKNLSKISDERFQHIIWATININDPNFSELPQLQHIHSLPYWEIYLEGKLLVGVTDIPSITKFIEQELQIPKETKLSGIKTMLTYLLLALSGRVGRSPESFSHS